MAWFRKKKVEEKKEELVTGLTLGEAYNCQRSRCFFTCIPKGFLCFLIIFGSFGGFLSAFKIDCNYVIAALVLLAAAMYFSFVKTAVKILDTLYFLFFMSWEF